MWNTFVFNNENYIIKISESAPYKISLSNIINLWVEDLSVDNIIERCKTLNPLFNTDNDIYIKTVLNLIESISEIEINIIKDNNSLTLECNKKIGSVTFKFNFNLRLSNLNLCREITVPLIQTIQYLEKKQSKLCDLLVKKDEEIQQHIFENGPIKREKVITEKFEIETFKENVSKKLCCNVFTNADDFNKTLIATYGCDEPELLTVKKEESKNKHKRSLAKEIIKSKRMKPETKNIKQEK